MPKSITLAWQSLVSMMLTPPERYFRRTDILFIAYDSDVSGRREVYLLAYLNPGPRHRSLSSAALDRSETPGR
jgi:hypothetical protein